MFDVGRIINKWFSYNLKLLSESSADAQVKANEQLTYHKVFSSRRVFVLISTLTRQLRQFDRKILEANQLSRNNSSFDVITQHVHKSPNYMKCLSRNTIVRSSWRKTAYYNTGNVIFRAINMWPTQTKGVLSEKAITSTWRCVAEGFRSNKPRARATEHVNMSYPPRAAEGWTYVSAESKSVYLLMP